MLNTKIKWPGKVIIFSCIILFLSCLVNGANGEAKNIDLTKAETAAQIKSLLNQEKLSKHPKIESVFMHLITLNTKEKAPAVQKYAQSHAIKMTDNKVQVVVELKQEENDLSFLTTEYGLEIQTSYQNMVQAMVPLTKIMDLAQDPRVNYLRRPLKINYHNMVSEGSGGAGGGGGGGGGIITSEGVAKAKADLFHQAKFMGKGIKVAVIDSSFNGYKNNPEIPLQNIIAAESFRDDGKMEDISAHGTACAEIVLDMAPEAGLYLLAIATDVEFARAVNYAISQKVDIISCSGGWNIAPFDGTGFICDLVNNARNQGILFVNSAGNYALSHYEGWFTDTDQDDMHEFAPEDQLLDLGLFPANVSIPVDLALSWDDWPESNQDYDLLLFGYDPVQKEGFFIDESINEQYGNQEPSEYIGGTITLNEPAYIFAIIAKFRATRNVHFELYSYYNNFPEYNHPESSLCCPADCAGALTVGATYWNDDSLEYFSSRGPTNDGRIKPDLAAFDGTSGSIYGLSTGNHDLDRQYGQSFFGTSAAAPHAAGAAALLKCAYPGLSVAELQNKLESKALDLGPPGKDNQFGAGRVNLLNLLPPGGTWQMTVNATNQLDPVTVGMAPNAIDEYDEGLDEYSGTPIQGKVIMTLDDTFAKSIKKTRPYGEEVIWDLAVGVPAGQTTNLHWTVPAGVEITVKEGNSILTPGATLGQGNHDLLVITKLTPFINFALNLKAGWNMLSLPLIPENDDASAIFSAIPTLSAKPVVTWEAPSFVSAGKIKPRAGYWVFAPQNMEISIDGQEIPDQQLNLKAGWNMVGTTGRTELNITSIPNQVTQNPAVTWVAPSFVKTDKIKPGESAWIFVTKDTSVSLSS